MSKRTTFLVGLIGLSLLVIGIIVITYANTSPFQRISYSPTPRETPSPTVPGLRSWVGVAGVIGVIIVSVVVALISVVVGLISVAAAFKSVVAAFKDRRLKRQLSQFLQEGFDRALETVSSWLQSLRANKLLVLTLLLLGIGTAVIVHQFVPPDLPLPLPTPTPTVISAVIASPYRAETSLKGPDRIRFGTSEKIELTISVVSNTIPSPAIPLTTAGNYSASVRIQAPNFDISKDVASVREVQVLSTLSSSRWAWVISPREKRLGSQELVFDVFIQDRNGRRIGTPYSSARVYVTDPIGIPPALVYVGTILGGVMSVPLWAWMYQEWSARQKEKREQQHKSSLSRKRRKR